MDLMLEWARERWWVDLVVALTCKSMILLGAAGAAAILLRRRAAAVRHLVWTLALGGTLVLPALALGLPAWSWRVLPAPAPARGIVGAVVEEPAAVAPWVPAESAEAIAEPEPEALGRLSAVAPAADTPGTPWPGWVWALGIWLAGVAAVLAIPCVGRIGLRHALRGSRVVDGGEWAELLSEAEARLEVRRRVELRVGGDGRALMPMTWGWLRPVVLVPAGGAGWSRARRLDVLLHELAHVRRRDGLTHWLTCAACAGYWFNPLVWMAAGRQRAERERACDDLVLATGSRPSDYAGHLLAMARDLRAGRLAGTAGLAMARTSQLEGRLLAILEPGPRRAGPGRGVAVSALAGLVVLVVPLSIVRLAAQEAGRPDLGGREIPERSIIVTGRVLDPVGEPVGGVAVDVVGRPQRAWVGRSLREVDGLVRLGQGETDRDGRFRVPAERTAANRFLEVFARAYRPGSGIGWAVLNPDAPQPAADVRLRDERTVRGKLVDATGAPAAGVILKVAKVGRRDGRGGYDGVRLGDTPPVGFEPPIVTDADGRFVVRGVGRGLEVRLKVSDPRLASQWITLKAEGDGPEVETIHALQPSTIVEGRILAADTGEPIADAVVAVSSAADRASASVTLGGEKVRADGQGHYRSNVDASRFYSVTAIAPDGQPYPAAHDDFEWEKGAQFDLRVPRGVLLRGKVTEQGTGRPVAGASVQSLPVGWTKTGIAGWLTAIESGPDGSFQIAVAPGKGHLLVFGPTDEYVLEFISSGALLHQGVPGGKRHYAHEVIAYDVRAGDPPRDVAAALRPGKTIRGRVIGPEGQMVDHAAMITTLHVAFSDVTWRGDLPLHAREGRFELRGLDPEATARVCFLDDEHRWGTTVEFSGKQAGADLTVRLEPCGKANARLVAPDGKPLARRFPRFEILGNLGTPDSHVTGPELVADSAPMPNVDRKHYWGGRFTDEEGRITLPDLIPGAYYRLSDPSAAPVKAVRMDFTVKPGETLELGDLTVEKPGR